MHKKARLDKQEKDFPDEKQKKWTLQHATKT
jgi:hypothetical protein